MRSTHPFPHIPKGCFEVLIEPIAWGAEPLMATINPIIVTMDEGCGSIDLISGFEILSEKENGAIGWSELNWLIQSGQYKVISPAAKGEALTEANQQQGMSQ